MGFRAFCLKMHIPASMYMKVQILSYLFASARYWLSRGSEYRVPSLPKGKNLARAL
jgi:hypothetical protein